MKFTLKIILVAVLLVVLVGCGKKPFDREHADFKYLNEEAIKADGYLNDGINDNTYDDKVKELKNEYVKWSATVIKVEGKKDLILQEEKLPKIKVRFEKDLDESVKVGDIITVSGTLNSYVHGLFGSVPIWKMKKGVLLETTDKELDEVLAYQQQLKDEELLLVNAEKEAEAKKKEADAEEEAKRNAELESRKGKYDETAVREAIVGVMGKSGYNKHSYEEGVLWMHLNLNKGFTSSHTIDTVHADVLKILKVLYQDGLIPDDTVEVDFAFEGVLTDSFGNDNSQVVAEIGFFPETIGKINFDNISRKKMPKFADYYWHHPAYD